MLDHIALDPIVASIAALLGVLLGLALGQVLLPGPRRAKRLAAEIEEMHREHAEYRARVTGHFHKTSDLIGQMTASYKAVYDHLSEGAQTLCAGNALPAGAFSSPRLILDETVDVSHEGVTPGAVQHPAQPAPPPQAAATVTSSEDHEAAAQRSSASTIATPSPSQAAADADAASADPAARLRFDVSGKPRADDSGALDESSAAAGPSTSEGSSEPRAAV